MPKFNKRPTYGRMMVGDEEYLVKSGIGEPGMEASDDPEIKAGAVTPGHAEGQAAMILRKTGASEGTITINNPGGLCPFCKRVLSNIVPEGSSLTVIWPNGNKTFRGGE